MHDCKYGCVKPQNNGDFWENKRQATVKRDAENLRLLEAEGWRVLIVWECWCKDLGKLEKQLQDFMLLD